MRRLALIPVLALVLVLPVSEPTTGAAARVDPGCTAGFRWSVRALADPAARAVARSPRRTTVRALRRINRPARLSRRSARTAPVERRLVRVRVDLVAVIAAPAPPAEDGAIELVVADGPRRGRLVVAFPHPSCVAGAPRARAAAARQARTALETACGPLPTTHFARLRGSAEIVAPAFFGSRPARPGLPPNGVELAPALSFRALSCARLAERPAVVAAAGDIACGPGNPGFNDGRGSATRCRQAATAAAIEAIAPDAVLALGDLQYGDATLADYRVSYDRTWGPFRRITRPVAGNHEYDAPGAAGYYAYWGRAARGGYYSFDLGAWHVIALDSNCGRTGACRPGSRMLRWLRSDLAAHANRCVLAYWHSPLFSSGLSGGDRRVRVFWRDLYRAGADVVLTAHDHDYERFPPLTPAGALDERRGLRQFVVGTGGRSLLPWRTAGRSEVRDNSTFGVLKLTLHPDRYEWQFVGVGPGAFTDAGSAACH